MRVLVLLGLGCCAAGLAASACAADYKVDRITVHAPWSRATASPDAMGEGYMVIQNEGDADDLISSVCSGALVTSFHDTGREHLVKRDMTTMQRHIATTLDQIKLPAHGTVELKPGGVYLMLENMYDALQPGEQVSCLLRFRRTGPLDIKLEVGAAGATAPPSGSNTNAGAPAR